MVKLYISHIGPLSDHSLFSDYLEKVDEARRKKALAYKKEEDRRRSLLAGYLIQVGVKEWNREESGLQADAGPLSLAYGQGRNGKPYLRDYSHIRFSLSHSGEYAVCGFSPEEIGVDIQQCRKIGEDIVARFYSREDRELMEVLCRRGMDGAEAFFRLWAVKEAYMKLTGEGVGQGLHNTVIEAGDKDGIKVQDEGFIRKRSVGGAGAYFKVWDRLENYMVAVCSYEKIADINIKWIKIGDGRG